jgi:hypothetical protein
MTTIVFHYIDFDNINYKSICIMEDRIMSDIWLFDCIEGTQRK